LSQATGQPIEAETIAAIDRPDAGTIVSQPQ
jgi:hypothetical protein